MLLRGIFLGVLVSIVALPAQAATLYIDASERTLGRGDAEVFKVRLDTDEAIDECVNTVSGVITFSGPVTPIDISLGESIFSLWVEQPTINPESNQITFAGGIPNGYCGRVAGDPRLTNTLFEIITRADTQSGELEQATVGFDENQTVVLLNDGFGTPATLTTLDRTVSVTPTVNPTVSDPWTERVAADTTPPQAFSLILEKGGQEFTGRYYVAFNTTDKETGIDRYEVIEEPLAQAGDFLWGRADAPWVETRSPYVLNDQSLNSTIRVKAVDKAGNEYVATLLPDEELRTLSMSQMVTYMLGGSVLLLILVGLAVLYRRSVRRRAHVTEYESDHLDDVSIEESSELTNHEPN